MNNKNTPERNVKKFALNLYKKFQSLQKPIEVIADDLGVEVRTVYYWTSGERIPSLERVVEITNYLSVSVDDLLQ